MVVVKFLREIQEFHFIGFVCIVNSKNFLKVNTISVFVRMFCGHGNIISTIVSYQLIIRTWIIPHTDVICTVFYPNHKHLGNNISFNKRFFLFFCNDWTRSNQWKDKTISSGKRLAFIFRPTFFWKFRNKTKRRC